MNSTFGTNSLGSSYLKIVFIEVIICLWFRNEMSLFKKKIMAAILCCEF